MHPIDDHVSHEFDLEILYFWQFGFFVGMAKLFRVIEGIIFLQNMSNHKNWNLSARRFYKGSIKDFHTSRIAEMWHSAELLLIRPEIIVCLNRWPFTVLVLLNLVAFSTCSLTVSMKVQPTRLIGQYLTKQRCPSAASIIRVRVFTSPSDSVPLLPLPLGPRFLISTTVESQYIKPRYSIMKKEKD